MKNVLLILFTAFLVAAPLLVGQEHDIKLKEQRLKHKIQEQCSKSIAFEHEILELMDDLNRCDQIYLSDQGCKSCSDMKNSLLAINDQYIPSEDEQLKRSLENPTDLDILDFTLKFSPNESIAINHLAELIDKNIERSKAILLLLLQKQQDPSLIENFHQDILNIENGWYAWFSSSTPDANQYSNNLNTCQYGDIKDKETMDQCLKVKEFIQKHTSKLNSDDKQRIAQLMINLIDANMAYNEEKVPYENALNNLYRND